MRGWPTAAAGALALLFLAGCSNLLGRKYEYEEQIYLTVRGAATVVIDASIPALVALRGLPVDPSRVDREQIRQLFATAGCEDARVGQPWFRNGRHFVQVRIQTESVLRLKDCRPMSWSSFSFSQDQNVLHYRQIVGAPTVGDPGKVNWDGSELVAFKLHLPSRILFHNVKRLEDGSNGEAERGNILTWEQRLADRRAGVPVDIEARMDAQSILYRTLWLFGGAFLAAVFVLGTLIWLTMRHAKGKRTAAGTPIS